MGGYREPLAHFRSLWPLTHKEAWGVKLPNTRIPKFILLISNSKYKTGQNYVFGCFLVLYSYLGLVYGPADGSNDASTA